MEETGGLLTVQAAARRLKVTPQYVRRLIAEEKLPAVRFGKQWAVTAAAFDCYLRKYAPEREPDDHARRGDGIPPIVALSFFSGAMGLDIGMRMGGIDALLACEVNRYCRMTIEKNRPDMALIGDVNCYEPEEIMEMARLPLGTKIEVIFGGPPCQAFSTAGARRAFSDDRGNVFLRYVEIIERLHPTYIVIENVRGLLSAPYPVEEGAAPVKGGALYVIVRRLERAGYTLSFELYNAANFGAPQIRERVVIIGKLGGEKVPYLSPTHAEHGEYGLRRWRTLREALADAEDRPQHYVEFPEKRLKFYRLLREGQYWKNLPPELQEEAMGEKLKLGGGKTGFYRRLAFDKPSPTLVTNPAMPATDLCHPTEDRPLSVEEYSRIQEFPEDWTICGPLLERYRQIGNAVPIRMGAAIARTILADMAGETLAHFDGFPYSRYKNTNDVRWRASVEKELRRAAESAEDG